MRESDMPTRNAIDAVWRIEAARLIGGLVRVVRDVDRAEDLAHEALLTALQVWPETGIPENPGAWLMTTAKNRAVDDIRRGAMMEEKHVEIEGTTAQSIDLDIDALDDTVGDDVLRLVLIACHPVLSKDARLALTLRLVVPRRDWRWSTSWPRIPRFEAIIWCRLFAAICCRSWASARKRAPNSRSQPV